ncbi:MAG: hypothetical protein B7Z66_11580 [Chromatiales bacterium 21-64-14]|nr:MAG: hypothetical protein B7Z66_11580 [Chromatiales bacterium 21-64-14]
MTDPADHPVGLRLLVERVYDAREIRGKFSAWHAPRLNRWERLQVVAGAILCERLRPVGIARRELPSGESCWFGPGIRWRVRGIDADSRIAVAPHAGPAAEADLPSPARSHWLDDPERLAVAGEGDLARTLTRMREGTSRLIHGRGDPAAAVGDAFRRAGGRFTWHPLWSEGDRYIAWTARQPEAITLADYLGRDHALIEAALARHRQGDPHGLQWALFMLERHMRLEETFLFDIYRRQGGSARRIAELEREHGLVREDRAGLTRPQTLRRFWRILEAHDEKEESLIYPYLTGAGEEGLLRAMAFPDD